jgi:hypothetical protein
MTSNSSKFSTTYNYLLNALDENNGVLSQKKIKGLQNILNLTENSSGIMCNRVTLAINVLGLIILNMVLTLIPFAYIFQD